MDCVTAGNVMVQLFMQTKPKYHLNNQKLQYLLCVARIAGVNAGLQLFEEPIRNLKNNFALEKIADNFTRTSAIQEGTTKQICLDLSYDDFVIPYSSKKLYAIKGSISDEEKRLLIDVFLRFGAYGEKTLCKVLNELKPLRNVPVWSYITSAEIEEFFNSDSDCGSNEVVVFCKERNVVPELVVDVPFVEETEDIPRPIDATELNAEQQVAGELVKDAPDASKEQGKTVEEAILMPPRPRVLSGQLFGGLEKMVVGKQYTLYIEAPEQAEPKDVTVVSLKDNTRVDGNLERLNNTVYCYSFMGVASDIKISIS